MCEACSGAVCYEGCPFYEKETAEAVCDSCGEVIAGGEERYARDAHSLCERCAESLSTDDLLDLGGLREIGDLLGLIGYHRV